MSNWSYTKGLHDLGNSVYAYLQPGGTWGWSNAGIITSGEASLLIDTLFDLKLTQEMLDTMQQPDYVASWSLITAWGTNRASAESRSF